MPESLRNEFKDRRWHRRGEDYGEAVGKWYAICTVVSIIPFVNYVAGPAALILWILFWVKVAGCSGQFARDEGYDREDDYDDRPRKRSRRDDEYEDDDEDDRPRGRRRDDDYDDEDEDDRPRRRR